MDFIIIIIIIIIIISSSSIVCLELHTVLCLGFPLGNAIQSKTKGIWAWCVDHPVNEDEQLLLLDTEGLGDIEKV